MGEKQTREPEGRESNLLAVRSIIIALIAAAAAIICVSIFIGGMVNYKKTGGGNGITATGSASCDFESDLIVWRGRFSVRGETPKDAYSAIKRDAQLVKQYLEENQVAADEMAFSSVSISQMYKSVFDDEGKYLGEEPDGYMLTQSLTVSSYDVDNVENISRDITELIEAGVEFESYLPEYYYTKLDEMKLDLIEKATANAKTRIDLVAQGTGARTGKLLSANLGVFQITAANSGSESYSYGGSLDTSSRYKTAMITVKLNYTAE